MPIRPTTNRAQTPNRTAVETDIQPVPRPELPTVPRPDPPSFEEFYRAEFASIAVMAGAILGDRGAGEDIAQEALSRAADQWNELSVFDRPGAWARRVAINLASNGRRHRSREGRALRKVHPLSPDCEQPERVGDPEVWSAVASLPNRQRAVVALHYLEELSVAEIADILEISVSATTSNLHKGRVNLASRLGEQL